MTKEEICWKLTLRAKQCVLTGGIVNYGATQRKGEQEKIFEGSRRKGRIEDRQQEEGNRWEKRGRNDASERRKSGRGK